jgi:hypothetical protein
MLYMIGTALSRGSGGRVRLLRYRFVAQPVTRPHEHPSPGTSVVVRQIAQDDAMVAQFPRPASVIAERFRMGANCFVAERQGRFLGFLWLKQERYLEDEVRCLYVLEPMSNAVWDFDVHVEPAFRLGRTFVRLWDYANAWMHEHGYAWTISRISAFNHNSLAAHGRFGIVPLGTATFLRFGRLQLALLDQAPFVHAGWRDDQAPTLHLRPPYPRLHR